MHVNNENDMKIFKEFSLLVINLGVNSFSKNIEVFRNATRNLPEL